MNRIREVEERELAAAYGIIASYESVAATLKAKGRTADARRFRTAIRVLRNAADQLRDAIAPDDDDTARVEVAAEWWCAALEETKPMLMIKE